MTKVELARRLNVSTRTIDYWERGARSPAMRRLDNIAAALGINVNKLIDEKMNGLSKKRIET